MPGPLSSKMNWIEPPSSEGLQEMSTSTVSLRLNRTALSRMLVNTSVSIFEPLTV